MIVRFGKPKYEMVGKQRGGRKPSVFSDKSHAERMKGGAKVMVRFRGLSKAQKKRPKKGRKKGKGARGPARSDEE